MKTDTTKPGTTAAPPEKRVERTDKDFIDGVCSGYLSYYKLYEGKPIRDLDVHSLIVDCVHDEKYTDLFRAGYVTGLIEGLLEDRNLFALPS